MANRDKSSALKALSKRPKLVPAIKSGKKTIHDLKEIGECSGGFIRTLIWAGICEVTEDKKIIFNKKFKEGDLEDFKVRGKGKEKEKDRPAKKSKVVEKASKKKVKEAEEEEEEDEEEDTNRKVVKKGKKEKEKPTKKEKK